MEIGIADAEAVADLGIGDGVGAHTEDGIGMGVEIAASDIREDEEEFEAEASAGGTMEIDVDPFVTSGIFESTRGDASDLEGTLYDIVHYMSEVPLDRITEFETAQRQLEAGQLMASGERASLTDRIGRLGRENLRVRALFCFERDRVDSPFFRAILATFSGEFSSDSSLPSEWLRHWLTTRQPVLLTLSRPKVKAKMAMTVIMEMVEMEMVEMEMVEMGMNLTVKNNDLAAYTQRFQELTLLYTRMVPREEDRIESLMDQKLKGYEIKSVENKRKFESNQRDNRAQQPPFKRQNVGGSNVARAYTSGGNEGRVYVGPHPLCNKCKLHHVWPCTVKCRSCGKIGYLTRDCKPAVPTVVNQRASVVNQRSATCFKCRRQEHFKKDCPKLKN
ncbi:putative reverse transcriptase domain-containing protein [Tanacetum coccineum]